MLKEFFLFLKLLFAQRQLIISMAKREIFSRYIGSNLGFVWTFIHPIVTIIIFWAVFGMGFKVQPIGQAPFVAWLTAGMAVWLVFADIINGSSDCIVANSHLIKKTLFQAHILPVVKIISCLITHSVFLLILICLNIILQLPFSIFYLQFIYYLFAMSVLALGLSWIVSALNPFIRDVAQIVNVTLQLGFWVTPIMWDISIVPARFHNLLFINPAYYLVQGYRDSFIYFVPFWQRPVQTFYYWSFTAVVLVSGALLFKKLKPHFPDVL